MSRRHRESENPVSLFPFLAVLICAMGVLIFLLIVSTSRIRKRAVQQAKQQEKDKPEVNPNSVSLNTILEKLPEPMLPSISRVHPAPREIIFPGMLDPNYRVRQKVLSLQGQLEKEQKNHMRLNLALKSGIRKNKNLNNNLIEKQNLRDRAQRDFQKQFERIELFSESKDKLSRELFILRKNIDEQNRKRAEVAGRFEIVPFEGRTGTSRRPILIECRENALTFLPENLTLSIANLEGFTVNNNPLLNTVKALVSYWHGKDKAKSGNPKEPFPYVLLLVRPSGSLAFYAARRMLLKLDVPFGYELIDEDWKLALPAVDDSATRLAQNAIRETIQKGRFLTRSNPNTNGRVKGSNANEYVSSDGRTIRFHKNSGTFEVVEKSKSTGKGRSSQSRFGNSRSFANRTFSKQPGRFPLKGFQSNKVSSGRTNGTNKEPRRLNPSTKYQRRIVGNGFEQNSRTILPNPFAENRDGDQKQEGVANKKSDHRNSTGNSYGNGLNGREWQKTREKRLQNSKGQTSYRRKEIERDFFNTPQKSQQSRTTLRPFSTQSRSSQSGRSSQRQSNQRQSNQRQSNQRQSNQRQSNQRQSNQRQSNQRQSNQRQSNQRQSNQRQSNQGHSNQGHSTSPNNIVSVPNPFSSSKTSSQTLNSLRSKSRWGFSSRRAVIGFERELTIRVGESFAKIGTGDFFAVSSEKDNAKNIELFINSVEKHVRSWGSPPERFYWIPSLRLIALPGGSRNAERLKSLAKTLRLPVKMEYPVDQNNHRQERRDDEK